MNTRVLATVWMAWVAVSGCAARDEPVAPVEPPRVETAAPATPAKPAEPARVEAPKPGQCASAESCFDEAAAAERAQQPERAAPLYTRACELGIGQACHRLGVMHQEGKGVARDEAKARELFEVGCRQDSAAACDALGH